MLGESFFFFLYKEFYLDMIIIDFCLNHHRKLTQCYHLGPLKMLSPWSICSLVLFPFHFKIKLQQPSIQARSVDASQHKLVTWQTKHTTFSIQSIPQNCNQEY